MPLSLGDALLKLGVDKSEFDKSLKETQEHVKDSMQKIQGQLKAVGVAFTAVGIAGMKMVSDAKKMNAELGQTALTLGVTTKDMRDLALATTDVTFPLKSVAATFDLLARAGIKDMEVIQKSAKAFDALGDATGSSADVMADMLLPAFKLFGKEIPTTSRELDKFTWLTKNTLVDLSDFGTLLTRLAPHFEKLNITMDDAVAILAALSEKGITGTAATLKLRTAVTQAAESGEDLFKVLGLTSTEIDRYKTEMNDATGITDKYAAVANTQFTILDKLKQLFSEISLRVGSFIAPLEGVLAAMTALGPIFLFLSTSIGLATAKWVAHIAVLVAHKIAALASTAANWLLNASLGVVGVALTSIAALITLLVPWIIKMNKATGDSGKVMDDYAKTLFQNKLMVQLTTDEWIQAYKQGYLTDQQIRQIAAGLKISTTELENNMGAAGMLQAQWSDGTETGKVFITQLEDQVDALTVVKQAIQDISQPAKDFLQSIKDLTAQWIYSNTQAGRLGVTMETFKTYMISIGREADLTADNFTKFGDDANKWAAGLGINLSKVAAASEFTTDKMISNVKDYTNQAKNNAQNATDAQIKAIDKVTTAEGKAHDTRMSNLDKEYKAELDKIDLALSAELGGYNDQINALQQQIRDMNDAKRTKNEVERIALLKSQIAAETDFTRKAELEKELANYLEELRLNEIERQLNAQIDTIRKSEDLARANAQTAGEIAKSDYDYKKGLENQAWLDFKTTQDDMITKLNDDLVIQLANYDTDLAGFQELLDDKLLAFSEYVRAYADLAKGLSIPYTPTAPILPPGTTEGYGGLEEASRTGLNLPGYATGGMIPEPTLLTSLRSMRPYAVAGEAGPERISPMNGGGGYGTANIIIEMDGQIFARLLGQPLVDEIRLRTGVRI